jgi:hypothetical protein
MDTIEKLPTYGTQDDEKQSKDTTPYVLDTAMRKQTQITLIRHDPSYIQMGVKTNITSLVFCMDRALSGGYILV